MSREPSSAVPEDKKRFQDVVFIQSGGNPLTSPSDVVGTVSNVFAANGKKPVLCNTEQRIRKVTKKNQLVRSHATAGQREVLLVPVDEEQLGQPEAQEPQGQGEAHSVSTKSSG